MKKFLIVIVSTFIAASLYAQSLTAADVAKNALDIVNTTADSYATQNSITSVDTDGKTTTMTIRQYYKKSAAGRDQMVIIIDKSSNASAVNTRLLSLEQRDGTTIMQVSEKGGSARRVSSGSFGGSSLTYDDMGDSTRSVDDDTHSFLSQSVRLNNRDCYQIQSVPNDTSTADYSKIITWVDKANFYTYQMETYNTDGTLESTVLMANYQTDNQGNTTPRAIRYVNNDGSSATIVVDGAQYGLSIPDDMFTTNYIETGKLTGSR
jgi:outer membrane lipoprotein-sorting protein